MESQLDLCEEFRHASLQKRTEIVFSLKYTAIPLLVESR